MNTRKPLPFTLTEAPFRTRDADRLGVPLSRLRAADLHRGVHGVRSASVPATTAEVCRLFSERMPDGAFISHATAAKLHGNPTLTG